MMRCAQLKYLKCAWIRSRQVQKSFSEFVLNCVPIALGDGTRDRYTPNERGTAVDAQTIKMPF